MVDDTRHGAGRVPPELRAWLDRLVREGSMLVEQASTWSVEVSSAIGEVERHLRGLSDDDYLVAMSALKLDHLFRLIDQFLGLDPLSR